MTHMPLSGRILSASAVCFVVVLSTPANSNENDTQTRIQAREAILSLRINGTDISSNADFGRRYATLPYLSEPLAVTKLIPAPAITSSCQTTENESTVKSLIADEATHQQVDTKLALAVAEQESGFGVNVNSDAGARGIMQLMPATASRYKVQDVCNAEQNIRGGVSYLKDLHQLFDGNILLVVAAYNAGEGRVLASGGIPPIAETVNYTARVTNSYYGFKNALSRKKQAAITASDASPFVVSPVAASKAASDIIPVNQPGTGTSLQIMEEGPVLYIQ